MCKWIWAIAAVGVFAGAVWAITKLGKEEQTNECET